MKNKRIVIFSGAGLDRESGVLTFRDCVDGLWENHSIDEVATKEGWKKDPKKVLDFYNARRAQMPEVEPNEAHKIIASLEDEFSEVINITQNVSDLLERGGSSVVYHLHGELTKARGEMDYGNPFVVKGKVFDIGYNDINVGDMAEDNGSQMRPHIVWFGEYPFHIEESYSAIADCDVLIIVGTSLSIGYTHQLLHSVNGNAKIYYVDPEPSKDLDDYDMDVEYIEESASVGMAIVKEKLLAE